MRGLGSIICGCFALLLTWAEAGAEVTLRLSEEKCRPGDVIELQAEMRRADYAKFELHVPAHPQLHFVAHTREPVRYVEGEYVQREILLLQPMTAGAFELNGMTATFVEGEQMTELALPRVQLAVESYAREDASQVLAELGEDAVVPAQSLQTLTVIVVGLLLLLIWFLVRRTKVRPEESTATELGLSDLIASLEAGEPAMSLIEHLLSMPDLTLPPVLRKALEAAAYAKHFDSAALLRLLKEEGAR